jgi:hypothetical protein
MLSFVASAVLCLSQSFFQNVGVSLLFVQWPEARGRNFRVKAGYITLVITTLQQKPGGLSATVENSQPAG